MSSTEQRNREADARERLRAAEEWRLKVCADPNADPGLCDVAQKEVTAAADNLNRVLGYRDPTGLEGSQGGTDHDH